MDGGNEPRRVCEDEGAGDPCPVCGEALGITVFTTGAADPDMWAEPGLACANGHQCREAV